MTHECGLDPGRPAKKFLEKPGRPGPRGNRASAVVFVVQNPLRRTRALSGGLCFHMSRRWMRGKRGVRPPKSSTVQRLRGRAAPKRGAVCVSWVKFVDSAAFRRSRGAKTLYCLRFLGQIRRQYSVSAVARRKNAVLSAFLGSNSHTVQHFLGQMLPEPRFCLIVLVCADRGIDIRIFI